MQIVEKNIINIAGAPIGNALITITDVMRTPILRNGNTIQRYSNANGSFIIPTLDTDYLHITHPQYSGILTPATNTDATLQLSAKGFLISNGKKTLSQVHTYILVSLVLIGISYIFYTSYKTLKK